MGRLGWAAAFVLVFSLGRKLGFETGRVKGSMDAVIGIGRAAERLADVAGTDS